MGRIMALDYGTVRIGVAISDPTQTIASIPEPFIKAGRASVSEVQVLVKKYEVEKILVGMPYGLKGDETQTTSEVKRFVESLRKGLTIEIETLDERYSTRQAQQLLGATQAQDRQKVQKDNLAAYVLLEQYLNRLKKLINY